MLNLRSPHIKVTAPDNDDASSKEKKTSSTTLDRIDSASDDEPDAKPSVHRTMGSFSDGSSESKKKTSSSTKVDIPQTNDDDSSKRKKRSHSTELPSYDTRSNTAKDDGYTGKKKTTDVSKSDKTYSASDDGDVDPEDKSSSNSVTSLSSHTNDGKSSSSDLASAIRNKVDSIIRNSLG